MYGHDAGKPHPSLHKILLYFVISLLYCALQDTNKPVITIPIRKVYTIFKTAYNRLYSTFCTVSDCTGRNCSTHTNSFSAIIGGTAAGGLTVSIIITILIIIGFVASAKRRKNKRKGLTI